MMDADVCTVPAGELVELATAVLSAAGTPEDIALTVARSLAESNLVGHDSHGVRRLVPYLDAVHDGRIAPAARPAVDGVRGATATVGGRRAYGQLSARLAVSEVRQLVDEHGAGVAAVGECNHVGRLGEYVADLAAGDLVALAFGNADPTVAPYGGYERRLGTNPVAWALPRASGVPLVMDWATSAVAEGKLAEARDRGRPVAAGLLVDRDGRASTDPADFYAGGALLPFGGHKGYGLSIVVEIVAGLLSGTGIGSRPGYDGGFGTVLVAFDVAAFTSLPRFRTEAEQFCRDLTGSPAAAGHEAVLVPGELEERTRAERSVHGVPLPASLWRTLLELPR